MATAEAPLGNLVTALAEFLLEGGVLTLAGGKLRVGVPEGAEPLAATLRAWKETLYRLLTQGELKLEPAPPPMPPKLWLVPRHLGIDGSCTRCGRAGLWWARVADTIPALHCNECQPPEPASGIIFITAGRASEIMTAAKPAPRVLREPWTPPRPVGERIPESGVCPHCGAKPRAWWRYQNAPGLYCTSCSEPELGASVTFILSPM